MEKEVWKDIKHYEGLYKVSNFGRVWSFNKREFKEPSIKENGYLFVKLYKNGSMKNEYIHRLVALAFIPNPLCLSQINHKDENKHNNCVENLEWCDSKYNNNYGTIRDRAVKSNVANGTYKRARERFLNHNPSKFNPKLRGINSYAKSVMCDDILFDCIKSCAEYYGINYGTMRYWLSGEGNIPKYFIDKNLRYVD